MNEFSDYFHKLGKRQSAVKLAKVIARNDDGTYQVADIVTGSQRRVSKTNPAEEYAINSWVYIGSPTGGRTVIGASDVILSRAPADQKGLSGSPPDQVIEGIPGVVVSKIVPDPIILTAGGAAVAASIYGAGFLAGPSYGDPGITDNVAPVVTPTRIDVSLVASVPVVGANYPLTVGGTRAPNAIQVIAAVPLLPQYSFDGVAGFQMLTADDGSAGHWPLTTSYNPVLFRMAKWDGTAWQIGANLGWGYSVRQSPVTDLGLRPGAAFLEISLDNTIALGGVALTIITVPTFADLYVPAAGNVVVSLAGETSGALLGFRGFVLGPATGTARPIFVRYRGN